MHIFSYSSVAASFCRLSLPLGCFSSIRLTYFILSRSSGEPRFANGNPMMTTARARSSAKFNPSDNLAPITANKSAPRFLISSVRAFRKNINYCHLKGCLDVLKNFEQLLNNFGGPSPRLWSLQVQRKPGTALASINGPETSSSTHLFLCSKFVQHTCLCPHRLGSI